jgi:hypothetical protein
MLSWVRVHSRVVAAIALVSLTTLTIWSAAPHGDACHDQECASFVPPHDTSAHRLGRESAADPHPLHCVLCHWTRIVRPPASSSHHLAVVVNAGIIVHEEPPIASQATFTSRPPLRGPPASPALI